MIQLYFAKRNPDVLKAERFFKERRVPCQAVDLTKHKLGRRDTLLDDPTALRLPILRDGQRATIGVDEKTWKEWLDRA